MPATIILDTNAVVALLGANAELLAFVATYEQLAIPATVVGELYFGAYKSGRVAANLDAISRVLADANVTVFTTDAETARHYGAIRDELRRIGRPIPVNDIWIAAVARQRALPLASRDAHFDVVAGLSRLAW